MATFRARENADGTLTHRAIVREKFSSPASFDTHERPQASADAMELRATWEPRKARPIDFSGLTRLEIRAECVMIRSAVTRLPQLEAAVIQGRYGLTDYADVEDKCRLFSVLNARRRLNSRAKRGVAAIPRREPKRLDFDRRALAEGFGKSHPHYGRIARKLEEALTLSENRAFYVWAPVFDASCNGYSRV